MKKTKIIAAAVLACVAATVFAGCNSQEPASGNGETAAATRIEGGQTQISVENTQGAETATDGYSFSYRGYDIVPGTEAGPIIDVLGDYDDIFQGASCAGQGMDTIYSYPGFQLHTYEEKGVETIRGVVIEDSLIDCNGIHIGQTVAEAKAIFGTPTQEDDFGLLYISGKTALQISTDGAQTIVSIVYRVSE